MMNGLRFKQLYSSYVDYANVECYDYYGPWDKRTGINAPLMKMDQQILTEAFMNIVIIKRIKTFYNLFIFYFVL